MENRQKKKKIWVAMPSGSGFPRPEVILNIRDQELPEGYELIFYAENIWKRCLVQDARNELVRKFLNSDSDYLWFVDDDNPPSTDALKYLLEADKDMISALVPLRHNDKYLLNIFRKNKHVTKIGKLPNTFEIDKAGTGCILMKRNVVEAVTEETLGRPYQFRNDLHVYNKKTGDIELYIGQNDEETYVFNDGEIAKTNVYLSEDLFFCKVAKDLGFTLWADKRAKCRHFTGLPEAKHVRNE